MRKSIEKNKKYKMKKIFITGLILTEGLLLSCERKNINTGNKEEKIKTEVEVVKKNYEGIMVDITEDYGKIPNTNLKVKMNKNEIYIKEGNKIHKIENTKNLSKALEVDGILYLIGIKERDLHFSSYEKNGLKDKIDFSLWFSSKNMDEDSHSVYIKEDWIILYDKKEGEKDDNNFRVKIHQNTLKNTREFYKYPINYYHNDESLN